jgi:YHS domain-containing protein
MAIDPVCGMDVDERTAEASAEYEGRRYYFCSAACAAAFDQDPRRYIGPRLDTLRRSLADMDRGEPPGRMPQPTAFEPHVERRSDRARTVAWLAGALALVAVTPVTVWLALVATGLLAGGHGGAGVLGRASRGPAAAGGWWLAWSLLLAGLLVLLVVTVVRKSKTGA